MKLKFLHLFTGAIIGLLVSIILACFTNSFAFHALVENFNSNCVSSASLEYRPIWYRSSLPEAARQQYANSKRYEDDSYADKVNHYYDEFKSHHLQVINASADLEATTQPKTKLYQLKSQTDDVLTTTTERYGYGLLKKKPAEMNMNDSVFFKTCELCVWSFLAKSIWKLQMIICIPLRELCKKL